MELQSLVQVMKTPPKLDCKWRWHIMYDYAKTLKRTPSVMGQESLGQVEGYKLGTSGIHCPPPGMDNLLEWADIPSPGQVCGTHLLCLR